MAIITTNKLNRLWTNGIKPIIDAVVNKLDISKIVNNNMTTAQGYALDARQANPNIEGTLANQVSKINSKIDVIWDKLFPGKFYIYQPNNEYTSITGGYINKGGTFTKGGTLKLSSPSNWAYAYTNYAFDITNYNTMFVKFRGSLSQAFCGLVSTKNESIDVLFQKNPTSATTYEIVMFDISNLSGLRYFQMQVYTNCMLEIAEIWFE